MRHRADHNQAEIVRALQKVGATVENTKGKLLDTQKLFHEEHSPAPIHTIRTVDDVIKWSRVISRAQKW